MINTIFRTVATTCGVRKGDAIVREYRGFLKIVVMFYFLS